MNVVAAKPQLLSDEQVNLIVQKAINRIFVKKWTTYLKDGWKKDAAAVAADPVPSDTGRLRHIRSLTPQQYELLRLMKPDGSHDFHLNTDFLKYLETTDEFGFLRKFKLNHVDPAELGHKEPSKP